jgi:hypothetical protein
MSDLTFVFKTAHIYRDALSKDKKTPAFPMPSKTRNHHAVDETVSSLRRSLRLGESGNSRYWVAQLDMAGLGETAWNVMIQFLFTDVGLASPIAPVCGMHLMRMWYSALSNEDSTPLLPHESWKSLECRKHLLTMATYVCTLPKSILVKNCNSVAILSNKGSLDPETDWRLKLGTNRKASVMMKPLVDGHCAAVKKASTCFFRALCAQEEWQAVRTADLLCEWGYTSIVWDMIEKMAIDGPRTKIDNTAKFGWCAFYVRYYQATWYWSIGRSNAYSIVTQDYASSSLVWPDPYYEFDSTYDQDDATTTGLYCLSIPKEWKSRHGQDPGIVCSRPIWVQTILLMVRGSNPIAMAGMLNQQQVPIECIPTDQMLMHNYSSDLRPKDIEDKALTMFTHRGREKNRGINHYFSTMYSDLAITNSVNVRDMYTSLAPQLYESEERLHGPGMTNDVEIVARRVNSGMLQHGLDQTNPNKPVDENECLSPQGNDSLSSLDESREEEPWRKRLWDTKGTVFRSRQEWVKRKLKKEGGAQKLADEKRLILIDTSTLIGLASTKEVKEHKAKVDSHFDQETQQLEEQAGLMDIENLLCECSIVSRELYPLRNEQWSVFHGNLKTYPHETSIVWGPMSVTNARLNRIRNTLEMSLLKTFLWASKNQSTVFGNDKKERWFFAQPCPLSIIELERGTTMYYDQKERFRQKKKRRRDSGNECPGNVRVFQPLLDGFYPPGQDWDQVIPILRREKDTSKKKRKGKTEAVPDQRWHRSRRAFLFLLYNMLRWIEKQPPLIRVHRTMMVSGKMWFSDAINQHQEPIHGYEEVDIHGRSIKAFGEHDAGEHTWYLQQQMKYIQKQLENAMDHWQLQWKEQINAWKIRITKACSTLKKMKTEEQCLFVKYLKHLMPQLEKIDKQKFIHWLIHRGFMLREPRLPTYLPMGYFNRVENLYYDDNSSL